MYIERRDIDFLVFILPYFFFVRLFWFALISIHSMFEKNVSTVKLYRRLFCCYSLKTVKNVLDFQSRI